MVPIMTSALLVLMVTSENSSVVLELPLRSTAPVVLMLPYSLLTPVPESVNVVSLDADVPTVARSIEPLPLLIARLNTPVTSPRITLPLLKLVMAVLTCNGLVRALPFRSILPDARSADGK